MSHSYVSNLMHCTFSTKERYPWIEAELESRLRPYIGGIARKNRMKALSNRRHIRSPTCAVVSSIDDEFCQGRPAHKRRVIKMGTR
jgi:hypothetical protein